jgi:hypothetical protein
MAAALKLTVDVAIGAIKVFQLIFPERCMLTSLDVQVDRIIRDSSTVLGFTAAQVRVLSRGP